MTRSKILVFAAFLVVLVFGCQQKMCGCVFPESPLKGDWTLTQITYGLTQKTVTATEAGYSETVSFGGYTGSGDYRQMRNGITVQRSTYKLSFPKGGITEGQLFFDSDSTQQSFRLVDNQLYLSERTPIGATIADGSTYEYSR
ncbi:hypothetical protein ACFSUS_25340 [Spirosoma soli]|uniref:Lipocalin-like domain-containing protein n=1 Tax=Spirosoma soli TaxID=1770529 RepID=A0ABW5MBY2_9BACT